jgi:hypothetical protein
MQPDAGRGERERGEEKNERKNAGEVRPPDTDGTAGEEGGGRNRGDNAHAAGECK